MRLLSSYVEQSSGCMCCECGGLLLPHHHYVNPPQLAHSLAVTETAFETSDVMLEVRDRLQLCYCGPVANLPGFSGCLHSESHNPTASWELGFD